MFTPGSEVRWWLLWASFFYALACRLRVFLYRSGWRVSRRLPVPVISVGNLTLGGTGKTPVVIQLTEWLLSERKRVAILSRGYRRRSRESQLLVSDGKRVLVGPHEAGDEPLLIARRCPRAIVAVGSDRYDLGRWILRRFPVDCFVLDDGFQHLSLHRDVNLLLVDATDVHGLDAVVPAGRLREPIEAAARASMIVITRADQAAEVERVIRRLREVSPPLADPAQMMFQVEGLISVTTTLQHPVQWCFGKTAVLCSAIGHAASFHAMAEALNLRILDKVVYPDHHDYTKEDVERVRSKASETKADLIVTTEKDAVKLALLLDQADTGWWALRLRAEITVGDDRLRQSILHPSLGKPVEVCV